MFLVNSATYKQRMDMCRACRHFVKGTQTCGTLGLGDKVKELGNEYTLCGCVMPVKAKLSAAKCSVDKWPSFVSAALLKEIDKFLNNVVGTRLTPEQYDKLHELYSKASGSMRKKTACKSCLRDMLKDLRRLQAESKK